MTGAGWIEESGAFPSLHEDPVFLVHGREAVPEAGDCLALTQEQVSLLIEAVMKHRNDPPLQLGVEINEDVSTADEVELGERRITGEVMLHEDAKVADPLGDLVTAFDAIEEAGQPFGRDPHDGRLGVAE